jgi:hypothetical protein
MKLYEMLKFIFMFLLIFALAYFNSAMLWMYQIDTYGLDMLAYINCAMLWIYQIDSYALDLLANIL